MSIEQIIEGCKDGDMEARKGLYELFASRMLGVVRRYVKDIATAEDLLHDGFIQLYTHIKEFRGEGSFEGWTRRLFVNTALSYLRKKNPLNSAEEVENIGMNRNVAPNIIDQISADEIMKVIDSLPSGYKMIFNLHAIDGYDYTEIAQMMNISEATARSQYMRARGKLAEMIQRY